MTAHTQFLEELTVENGPIYNKGNILDYIFIIKQYTSSNYHACY